MSNEHMTGLLAMLAQEWKDNHQLYLTVQAQITQLKEGGVVVVKGEEEFMAQLSSDLDEIERLWNQIKNFSPDDEQMAPDNSHVVRLTIEEMLTQLETNLFAEEWDLLEMIKQELEEKVTLEQEIYHEYSQELNAWPINHLLMHLRDALRVKAPVRLEKIKIEHWREKITQAERYLKEQQYEFLEERLEALRPYFKEAQEMLEVLPKKEKIARKLFQQAELLLIQTSTENKKPASYAVLFRSLNQERTLGINLHNPRQISPSDRNDLIEKLRKISRTIRHPSSESTCHDKKTDHHVDLTRGSFSSVEEFDKPSSLADELKQIGELIYRLFIPEQIRRYLSQHRGALTITTDDLELPWELMSYQDHLDQTQTLCLNVPVGRIQIGRALPNMKPIRPVRDKIVDFLLICSDPDGDLPEAEREITRIKAGLEEKWKDEINIDVLKGAEVTGTTLNKIMLEGKYDVIHYAGHAYFNEKKPELSGLLLHDKEVFFAQKVFDLLEGRPLVFLNACESGVTANEGATLTLAGSENPVNGLASAFIYGGALGCIGSLWPVYDRSAAEFAIHFYNLVLEGHMIGEAVRQSRWKIRDKDPNDITWAAFILYGDPTFVLDQASN